DICHTNIYSNTDKSTQSAARAMFEEQVGWAAEEGADFIVAETFSWAEEALTAVEVVKQARLPVVATLAVRREPITREGWTLADACKRLEDAGADVVGLNCYRGPSTMLPLLGNIRRAVKCHVAALPVPYRTTEQEPTFMSLRDPGCDCLPGEMPFPLALDPFYCNRFEIAKFARGVRARRQVPGRLLRSHASSDPQHGRGARPHAARQRVLARHVDARFLRYGAISEPRQSRIRKKTVDPRRHAPDVESNRSPRAPAADLCHDCREL